MQEQLRNHSVGEHSGARTVSLWGGISSPRAVVMRVQFQDHILIRQIQGTTCFRLGSVPACTSKYLTILHSLSFTKSSSLGFNGFKDNICLLCFILPERICDFTVWQWQLRRGRKTPLDQINGVWCWLNCLMAMWPWASQSPTLDLNFLILS